MNYLAHAYLSFGNSGLLAGNMFSDHIKGRAQYTYPDEIRKGIILHRNIDNFTDSHHQTAIAKKYFQEHYRLYAAPITDIIFDHYLATDHFEEQELLGFTQWVYQTLEEYEAYFPDRFARIYPYMKSHNWLFNYRHKEGIERSLQGLARRSSFLSEGATAFRLFEEHYEPLRECFTVLFRDVKNFAKHEAEGLLL